MMVVKKDGVRDCAAPLQIPDPITAAAITNAGVSSAEVGEGGRPVSGGQRQRLALARALLHSPDGLVLIDPTTSIDAVTTATIARKVRQLRAVLTTIIATTSPALLDQMDEVVLLDADGR